MRYIFIRLLLYLYLYLYACVLYTRNMFVLDSLYFTVLYLGYVFLSCVLCEFVIHSKRRRLFGQLSSIDGLQVCHKQS